MTNSPYPNAWARLVAEKGEAGAKQYMKELRKKVKKHPGGGFRDKQFAKAMSAKAVEARKKDAR